MDPSSPATAAALDSAAAAKRKRSPSVGSVSAPVAKVAKTSSQLSINYLARQSHEDLPLINKDDPLPNLLHLLSAYSYILDRHESLASNLGARPLGPILIKRFERCFDASPKIVASHHKNATGDPTETNHTITWLEVIEFARAHPGQFTLSTFSEGRRVCQFYYPQKQLRVQISEEDFLFINSGRCQELIPPLPIWEDEEKEMGTCDVLEAKLKELTNVADMVAARTRQLSHRLKGRRAAILERRAEGGSGTPAKASAPQMTTAPPSTSGSGFVAVNSANSNGRAIAEGLEPPLGSNAAVRTELLRHFESLPHNQNASKGHARNPSATVEAQSNPRLDVGSSVAPIDSAASNASSLSPVPMNVLSDGLPYSTDMTRTTTNPHVHRPSLSSGNAYPGGHTPLKHNFSRPLPPALESSQPFRPLCQAHMDSLPRGTRVMPPCDRCRRLRMDCVKNLTSCAGCTRKHARCHWRDVSREELGALDHLMDSAYSLMSGSPMNGTSSVNGYAHAGSDNGDSDDDDSNPLEDLEALGEKEEQECQIREDEEGLRNAKELARQGFEVSMRDGEPVQGAPAEADPDTGDVASATAITEPVRDLLTDGDDGASKSGTKIQEIPNQSLSQPHVKAERELPMLRDFRPAEPASSDAAINGFRPVNDLMNNGTTMTQAETGWRAV